MRKVNWHIDNRCNMNCRYCFCDSSKRVDAECQIHVLRKLRSGFEGINFVGGEPTISSRLLDLLRASRDLGFETSIVTNGYRLVKEPCYLECIAPFVGTIGISVDSLRLGTNARIGRSVHGNAILRREYVALCKKIKDYGIKLKINTVVSRFNLDEDFNSFYYEVKPDKIKFFQVLKPNQPFFKHNFDDCLVSKEDFDEFCLRHSAFKKVLFSENNDQMLNSYYILNSSARFKNDETGVLSDSLVDVSLKEALEQVNINYEKYKARYAC